MLRTALKGLLAHKLRLLTTALAVTLGVSLMSGTLVLTDTMQQTFNNLQIKAPFLIADGHHRYETALNYRNEHPENPAAQYVMMTFVNMYSPGLKILATHRVLRRSEAPWSHLPTDPAVERMVSLMAANSATHVVILSDDPIDLLVLAVPVISADPATETAIALVQRILVMTDGAARGGGPL